MDDITRARLAADVLNNDAFRDAFDQLTIEVFEQWQRENNPHERERLWLLMQSQKNLKRLLSAQLLDGQVALRKQHASGIPSLRDWPSWISRAIRSAVS